MDVDASHASDAPREAEPPADGKLAQVAKDPPAGAVVEKEELTDAAIADMMRDINDRMGREFSQAELEDMSFQDALT